MKFASVIPLYYGVHTEEAVTILDTNWANLLRVLDTPNAYLDDCMRNDFQLQVKHRPWVIRKPAFADVVDIRNSCPFESAFFGFAEEHFGGNPVSAFAKFDNAEESEKKSTSEALFKDLTEREPFNNGFFMLRFAVDTAVLHIGCVAPAMSNDYEGGLTGVTQSLCSRTYSNRTGTLHVDLVPSAGVSGFKTLIAHYVIDAVSDFEGHLARIAKQPAFRYNPYQIAGPTLPTANRGQIPFEAVQSEGPALELDYVLRPASSGPAITIEWLSDDPFPSGFTPCVYYPECKCCVDPATGKPVYDVPGMVCKLYYVGTSG